MTTVITVPSEAEILERNAATIELGSDHERAVRMWAAKKGGQRQNAYGVHLSWFLIVDELAKSYGAPSMLRGMLMWQFEEVIAPATFADQPEFLAELQAVMQETSGR